MRVLSEFCYFKKCFEISDLGKPWVPSRPFKGFARFLRNLYKQFILNIDTK